MQPGEGTVRRLGRNKGGYFGETVSIQDVLSELGQLALAAGWQQECFLEWHEYRLCAYHRRRPQARHRAYLSTGIHGDEPAGPLALLELVREDAWPQDIDIWLCPCLNPTGFALNRRENIQGIDLNRDYRQLLADEVRAHVQWLERQPQFDLTIVLHEDWEAAGFYLYELNPDGLPSIATEIIEAVQKVCPIDTSPMIDNWPAAGGIIRPDIQPIERADWPEGIYLISNKTRQSYTFEAPSDFALPVRVKALMAAVRAGLSACLAP